MKKSSTLSKTMFVSANQMFGIRSREVAIEFFTKAELHDRKRPSWTKLNKKKVVKK